MQEKLKKLGGELHEGNIVCMKCKTLKSSGFDPDYGIQLCANRLKTQTRVEDSMTHGILCPQNHNKRIDI